MPLTKKGKKIKRAMERFYGTPLGTRVFYASERKGILEGVKKGKKAKKGKKRHA